MNRPTVYQRANGRSKYGATKTVVDGITFASKREAKRYAELKLLEKAGEIKALQCQPVYSLHAYCPGGNITELHIGNYVADFVYIKNGKPVIEDVKGVRTPLYKWKKKHVEAEYGIEVVEI